MRRLLGATLGRLGWTLMMQYGAGFLQEREGDQARQGTSRAATDTLVQKHASALGRQLDHSGVDPGMHRQRATYLAPND